MSEDTGFNIAVYARTDVGMVRPGNEDNFLVLNLSTADTWTPDYVSGDPSPNFTNFTQSYYGSLLAVTDGMGGALAGEVASHHSVECVRDRMLELQASPTYTKLPFHERLRLSIELANLYIYQMSLKRPECAGMGATFTAAGLYGTTAYFGQVGDSRAYLIRRGQVQQITRDQSLVGQLVEAGHITEEEAERHTYKNVILQALGASQNVNVIVDKVALRDLDILLLCSDGLSNKLRADEMMRIIDGAHSLKEACDDLITAANRRGGEDNITVVVAQVTGGKLLPAEASARLSPAEGAAAGARNDRWGAETIPRDPDLPHEIDLDLVDDEEETLPPPTEKLDGQL
ncbi:MAG TPA: PP2C family serine/threonine-protein phosphatase [Blastocatellia bacterium]|nr:PP2C family serine/threonine-protein phosphatase [Blastocatellia bacterium]